MYRISHCRGLEYRSIDKKLDLIMVHQTLLAACGQNSLARFPIHPLMQPLIHLWEKFVSGATLENKRQFLHYIYFICIHHPPLRVSHSLWKF